MGQIIWLTTFFLASSPLRDELINNMGWVASSALPNEQNVAKLAILAPRNAGQETILYSFEEYASQETYKDHLDSPPVKDLDYWVETSSPYVSEPLVTAFQLIPGLEFISKNEVNTQSDPYIIIEESEFQNTTALDSILLSEGSKSSPYYAQQLVNASRAENGTLLFGLFKEEATAKLWTVAAYESEKYLQEVHAKSPAAVGFEEEVTGLRTGPVKRRELVRMGGFLHRRSPFQIRPDAMGL